MKMITCSPGCHVFSYSPERVTNTLRTLGFCPASGLDLDLKCCMTLDLFFAVVFAVVGKEMSL